MLCGVLRGLVYGRGARRLWIHRVRKGGAETIPL